MRIITGIFKGRKFDVPHSFKARPTTDFAKENLFNVLTGYVEFNELHALDLFCGTGSISLELLSRGCRSVTSIEMDREHCRFIAQCAEKLKVNNHILLRRDVFRFLKTCKKQYDFIFADPPYALRDLEKLPQLVLESNILTPQGLFVLEHGKANNFENNPLFLEHREYGSVNFSVFRQK